MLACYSAASAFGSSGRQRSTGRRAAAVSSSRRRGVVIGTRDKGSGATAIEAEVPLAEMFGYIGNLRSATAGRGDYAMAFAHFAEVPARIQEALLAA